LGKLKRFIGLAYQNPSRYHNPSRKYERKKKKSLASFYIFGYLMEHRIESDDFLNYKIRFFLDLATKQLKKQECTTTLKKNCHLAKFRPKTKCWK